MSINAFCYAALTFCSPKQMPGYRKVKAYVRQVALIYALQKWSNQGIVRVAPWDT